MDSPDGAGGEGWFAGRSDVGSSRSCILSRQEEKEFKTFVSLLHVASGYFC